MRGYMNTHRKEKQAWGRGGGIIDDSQKSVNKYKQWSRLKLKSLSLSLHKLEYVKVFGWDLFAKSLTVNVHYAGLMICGIRRSYIYIN
jgi:hypothetical protein